MIDPIALKSEIRGLLGNPLTAEISDATIASAINASLIEYSRYRPIRKPIMLQIAVDIAEYSLDADVIGVLDCTLSFGELAGPDAISALTLIEFEQETFGIPLLDSYYRRLSPSSINIFERYRTAEDNYYGYDAEFMLDENSNPSIKFTPPPRISGSIPMVVGLMHTPASFPLKDRETLKLYALAEAMESLASFREKIEVVPTNAGYKMTLDKGTTLLERARQKKEEFERKMGTGTSWFMKG